MIPSIPGLKVEWTVIYTLTYPRSLFRTAINMGKANWLLSDYNVSYHRFSYFSYKPYLGNVSATSSGLDSSQLLPKMPLSYNYFLHLIDK